ncbi:MAG TPA: GAF domain-containing protein [Candidatus Melainabacteria bacterium]|nr:GAF domain-containing protein [Candidatus Melainabacteria bacterium]
MDSTVCYGENWDIAYAVSQYETARTVHFLNIPKEAKSDKGTHLSTLWALSGKVGDLLRGSLRAPEEIAVLARKAAEEVGQGLGLERCAILLFSDDGSSLVVTAEYSLGHKALHLGKNYHLGVRSEFSKLLKDGRPLPLQDILSQDGSQLESFVGDTKGAVMAFPLIGRKGPIGCLTMHEGPGSQSGYFSDQLIEACEGLVQQVAILIEVCNALKELNQKAVFFSEAGSACLIVNRETMAVLSANASAALMLTGSSASILNISLSELLAPKALVVETINRAASEDSAKSAHELVVSAGKSDGTSVSLLAYPIHDPNAKGQHVAVILYQQRQSTAAAKSANLQEGFDQAEGQANLTKQLTWERWMRQIVCRVHSSLDRDSIMQSVVDSLGRALCVSRCMVVRTESVTAPIVTHEFAEPDVSPLGLGRTGQFPARTASHFKTRVKAVSDIVSERPNLQISDEELEWFLENGFSSIAGAPISHHGHIYGVVVAISCGAPRKWLPHELDMLEVAAAEAAIALENSQAFMQVKDQLFNMNLLGNLTQQLTNTLEMASRTNRPEGLEDKGRSDAGGPPLSFRELEVLKLIASGLANREIAQRLFLTESTVELHASRIRKKLKLKSRTALVKYACDNDLV